MFAVVALVVALLVSFPTTRIGWGLHRLLIVTPARRLNALSPGRVAFYAALGAAGLILWFGMFDVALFLDVFILAVALGAGARFRAMSDTLAQGVRQVVILLRQRPAARSRAPKARPVQAEKPGSADPDPSWAVFA